MASLKKWFKDRAGNVANVGSKAIDQLNVADGGRTWKQRTPTQDKSTFQQAGQFGGQLARGTVGGTARFANTAAAQVPQVTSTARMLAAQATGNDIAWRNANKSALQSAERFKRGQGGILNTGTLYGKEEAKRGDLKTGIKRIGGGTVEAQLEAGTFGLGSFTGKQILKQGLKQGVRSQLPTIAKNAVLNTAQGGVAAANQGASLKDTIKSAAIGGTLGTAADVGIGLAGAAATKGIVRPTVNAARNMPRPRPMNEAGFIKLPQRNKPFVINEGVPTVQPQKPLQIKAGVPLANNPLAPRRGLQIVDNNPQPFKIVDNSVPKRVSGAAEQSLLSRAKNAFDNRTRLNEGGYVQLPNLPRRSQSPLRAGMSEDEFFQRFNPAVRASGEVAPDVSSTVNARLSTLDVPSKKTMQLPEDSQPTQLKELLPQQQQQLKARSLNSPLTQSTPIKVKGAMSDADYKARYGKDRAGKDVKVKPFTAEDYAFEKWNDKSTLGLSRETLERNLDRVAGADAPKVKKFLVESSRNNETARADFLNTKRAEVKDVIKKLGIKKGSTESALVQKYGEKLIDVEELVQQSGSLEKAAKIKEASEYFRNQYDGLLDQWNAQRKKYGYDEVPKRDDYFRHFQEIEQGINALGMIGNARDLPTSISGITDIFKPNKPFSNAELRRYGKDTDVDAVGGFDNYLDSVSRQIFHTDTVQKGRQFEGALRKAAEANPEIELPNFVANVSEWTNLVSGKKARLDRAAESVLGRKVYTAANVLRKQTGANMIGANLSSAFSNFIPFTQSLATTAKPSVIRGMMDTLGTPFSGKVDLVDGVKSGFLTRRFVRDSIENRGLRKASEVASTPFRLVDEFTSRSIVAAKYFEGKAKGLDPKTAMKQADDYAARVITDRSIGQTPNLLNSQTTGFLTQFQTEVNNQVSFLIRDIPQFAGKNPAKIASALTQFMVFSYLFNSGYEKVMGRRPQIDPINAGLQAFGIGEDNERKSVKDRVTGAAEDIATGLPFTSLAVGGRLPVSAAMPDIGALQRGISNAVEGEGSVGKNIYKGVSGPLFYLAPPFGGGQLKKTLEAANTQSKGYSETPSGQVRFEANKDLANKAKSLIFGQYASESGKQYIKDGIKPFGENDSEMFKTTKDSSVLNQAKLDRTTNKEQEKIKSSDKNLKQLSDGTYYGKIGDKYEKFDSESDYKTKMKKKETDKQIEAFKSSKDKVKTIGDTVYQKKKNGDVFTKSKYEYEYDKKSANRKLELDRAYEANNLEGYVKLAGEEYDALEKLKGQFDKDTEQDKIDALTLKQENLRDKVEGYIEKGYTKKGGGKGKKASIDLIAKAKTVETPKIRKSKLSVKAPSIPRAASVRTPRVANKPRNRGNVTSTKVKIS